VRDHSNTFRLNAQELFDLIGCEARDCDDQVAAERGLTSLFRKARTEFGRGVLAGDDEEIVKCGHGPAGGCVYPLVQRMKQVALGRTAQNPS